MGGMLRNPNRHLRERSSKIELERVHRLARQRGESMHSRRYIFHEKQELKIMRKKELQHVLKITCNLMIFNPTFLRASLKITWKHKFSVSPE